MYTLRKFHQAYPLHISHIVETDSDTSNSASIDSNMCGYINSYSESLQHQHLPHAYIAIVIGLAQQGTPCLLALASVDDFLAYISSFLVESHISNLGDSIDDLYLLFDEAGSSLVVTRAHSNPLVHSLHDRSSQVDMIVDPYVQ